MSFFNKKIVLKFLFTTLFSFSYGYSIAQVPTSCFEIESILVDACGSPEGENEMVRFKVGPTALNTSNITVNWPNNSWQGICQNATTTGVVTSLNSTILSCGLLIEPTGGVLPAGANVLIITSTAIDVTANSFANLSDTLYVIFQCAGNTTGHFANYNTTPGLRTLIISFSVPANCSDTVTYDRTLLVNQNGTLGGTTALKNGALANFDWPGNISYDNQGCQAPFNPTSITADTLTTSSLTICPGDSINIFATTQGGIQSIFWTGGLGSFSNPTIDSTTYFSSLSDSLPFLLIVGGISSCNDTIFDSLLVNITSPINVSITGNDTINLCQGQNLTLTANGAPNYLWSTGGTSNSINVSTGGIFSVTGNNACFSDSDSVFVNLIPQINVSIAGSDTITLCQGNSLTLNASGAPNYLWNTGSTLDSIIVSTSGSFFVTTSNSCFTVSDTVQVNVTPQVNVSILGPDTVTICTGNSTSLHAAGASNYIWSTGSSLDSIVVSTAGSFFVTTSNSCFTVSDTVQVNIAPQLTVSITEPDTINICQGDFVTLHATGASSFLWNTTATTDSITVNTAGTYSVSATGNCPSNTDSVLVILIPQINISILEGNPTILCPGSTLTLHANGGANYLWNTTETTDSIIINAVGQYYVSSSNGVCPTVFDTINIINDVIPAAFISGDSNLCIGSTIILNANGVGNFSWSTGAFGSSTIVTSAQQIILTSNNSCNNSISDTLTVTEEDCSIPTGVFIPNILTPNSDGSNDDFKITGINISSMEGSIYNRWGQLLFEWNDLNISWDGTYKGDIVPEGTYFYIIKTTFITDITENFKGTVLLLK